MRGLFAITLFVSSALLFVVQPMFGKSVLPYVGATPAAWTTCMVFFQTALLAGYAYAHLVRIDPLVHVALLLACVLTLPIGLASGAAPPAGGDPTLWLLGQLVISVGAPFLALAASAPLLQRWFPGAPYGLYAASNAGSLASLVAYPLLIEPALPAQEQTRLFSIGYGGFVVLVLACALVARRAARPDPAAASGDAPTWASTARWIALAFVPSSLLLGTTTYIATDIASVPLLWIVPLALYLVSFILVFARPPTRPPPVAIAAFMILLLVLFVLALLPTPSRPELLAGHLAFLFLGALVFHGELVRTRPAEHALTRFYLALAAGGALGGAWNAVAPILFTRVSEYPITMALACLLLPRAPGVATAEAGDRERALLRSIGIDPSQLADLAPTAEGIARRERRRDVWIPLATSALAALTAVALAGEDAASRLVAILVPIGACLAMSVRRPRRLAFGLAGVLAVSALGTGDADRVRYRDRSFFGVLRVEDIPAEGSGLVVQSLVHGTILHGAQILDPAWRRVPIGYYHREGPVGQIFAALRARAGERAKVAVIGLGTGVLAAYGARGDRFVFFEIDAAVERIARDPTLFTWLADTPASVDIVLGDARSSLAAAPGGDHDALFVDAFSSDAIPMHLITREALALYLRHAGPHALVVFHVSSRHFRLDAEVGALARDAGLVAVMRRDLTLDPPLRVPSVFVVLARSAADLGPLATDPRWSEPPARADAWTDDFANLVRAIDW